MKKLILWEFWDCLFWPRNSKTGNPEEHNHGVRLMTTTTKDTTTKMKDTVPPKNAKGIITVAKFESEHSDEIILPKAKAEAAGVKVSTIEPGTFEQVIKTSGQAMPHRRRKRSRSYGSRCCQLSW